MLLVNLSRSGMGSGQWSLSLLLSEHFLHFWHFVMFQAPWYIYGPSFGASQTFLQEARVPFSGEGELETKI